MSQIPERRNAPRVPYELRLFVAPYGGQIPDHDEFREVTGRDISTHGISYVSNQAETPGSQIVVLARSDAAICVLARVIHCQEIPGVANRYVVGCVLERRLTRES